MFISAERYVSAECLRCSIAMFCEGLRCKIICWILFWFYVENTFIIQGKNHCFFAALVNSVSIHWDTIIDFINILKFSFYV